MAIANTENDNNIIIINNNSDFNTVRIVNYIIKHI